MSKQPARAICDSGGWHVRKLGIILIGVLISLAILDATWKVGFAQKGTAESDWYPVGYSGDTWTGEVTALDNDHRTLTLTHGSGKNAETLVASIPDAPYQWRREKPTRNP